MMAYQTYLVLLVVLSLQTAAVTAQKCYRPEIPAFAAIIPNSDTYQPGSAVSYSCTNGQTPTGGNTTRSCNQDGNWTGAAPLCFDKGDPIVCGIPPQAPLTRLVRHSSNNKPGVTLLQECKDGYGSGVNSYCTCKNSGRWDDLCHSSVRCEVKPSPPGNFSIEIYSPYYSRQISLHWSMPNPADNITAYRFRCNNSTSWESRANYTSGPGIKVKSGFKPYSLVKCEMSFVNSRRVASDFVQSGTIRLPCAAPDISHLQLGQPTLVVNSGRQRWRYDVKWKLASANCAGMDTYPYEVQYPHKTSKIISLRTNGIVVYVDKDRNGTFTLWAKNNKLMRSSGITRSFGSPSIVGVPDHPVKLHLAILNSSCVRLSWSYPNSSRNLTGFQYECESSNWALVPSYTRTIHECGFKTKQKVTCRVRAVIGATLSNPISISSDNRTACHAPSPPSNLVVGRPHYIIKPGTGIESWRYIVSWQPPYNISCDHLDKQYPYIVKFPMNTTSTLVNTSSTSMEVYSRWNSKFVFYVWARNNEGLTSKPASISVASPIRGVNSTQTGCVNKTSQIKCPKELRGVANQKTGRGFVDINFGGNNMKLSLPIGEHPYQLTTATGQNCSLSIIIYNPTLIRRLGFEAHYKVACRQLLDDSVSKKTIENTMRQNYDQIRLLCGQDCNVTSTSDLHMSCTNSTLLIRWPTDTTFQADVKDIPRDIGADFTKRLLSKAAYLPIADISRQPPIVYPVRNHDGSYARVVLRAECTDGGTYNQARDMCEKSQQ